MAPETAVLGWKARMRHDKSTGALEHVSGMYTVEAGAQHVINNALRRSIADAYAGFVGQVRISSLSSAFWCYDGIGFTARKLNHWGWAVADRDQEAA